MKGDFSRLIHQANSNYISVLRQQGRVELDSDWNEQAEIWAEYIRQLTCDLLGEFAVIDTPNEITGDNSTGLKIGNFTVDSGGVINFDIFKGVAYIGGYQYRLEKDITFGNQPDFPEPDNPEVSGDVIIFIEAWKKSINYIDDEFIREPALGGPDTSLRSKITAQVKALGCTGVESANQAKEIIRERYPGSNIRLTFQIDHSSHQMQMSFGEIDMAGGLIPGNLHYRIELHRGVGRNGGFIEGIKWSDENASMVVKIVKTISEDTILVEESEGISGESYKEGEWIEIGNIVTELHREGSQMARIKTLVHSGEGEQITLDNPIHPLMTRQKIDGRGQMKINLAPRIRRWSGFLPSVTINNVYDLGRGIKAKLQAGSKNFTWEPGDYWVYAIRDRDYNKKHAPKDTAPAGVKKYRYPLAIIKRKGDKFEIIDCRRLVKPLIMHS